ncbi:MAG: M1 family metallopeptidase [Bacteroidales bacterium]
MKLRNITYILIFLLSASAEIFGQDYFQQDVNYRIKVSLDDKNHILRGYETIEYTNNSPDDLHFLYFHLWPNAYSNNKTALARQLIEADGRESMFNDPAKRGFIDSLNFKVNGSKIDWEFHKNHKDICKLLLDKPLESGETIKISTPFRVKLPLNIYSRMGYLGQTYKITQWYPKPAVYDHKGWHPMPYLEIGEFYSEFGSFDVSITLPENYVVAASGNLETQEEIDRLNEIARETVRLFDVNNDRREIPESSPRKKTIRYRMDNSHDFAWFADKQFRVIRDSIQLPSSDSLINSWVFFVDNESGLWQDNVNEYIHSALRFFSEKYGAYPYNNCSVVLGEPGSSGNNMEYPGITVIGHHANEYQLEQVIAHELAHNWFYGMLGFNERKYPFLDEGLTSLSEMRYMQSRYGENFELYKFLGLTESFAGLLGADGLAYKDLNDMLYLFQARQKSDQPINTSSEAFTFSNYVSIAYGKSARAFEYLMHFLGEKKFDVIMQEFSENWKYRHPYPEDIQAAFEKRTDDSLDWFFNDLIGTTNTIDYTFKKIKNNKILIKNKGEIPAPVLVEGKYKDSKTFSNWHKGFSDEEWIEIPDEENDILTIDPGKNMLELYRHNNFMRTKGIFKKTEPLKLEFAGLVNKPGVTQVHYFPVLGWNYYDKAMPGIIVYDSPFPPEKFNYSFIPMYSTGNSSLAGTGDVNFSFYPDHVFHKITLDVSGKRYSISDVYEGQMEQLKTELKFRFKNKNPRMKAKNRLVVSAIHATDITDISARILEGDSKPLSNQQFIKASLVHDNMDKTVHPYQVSANMEWNKNFAKTWFEGKFKYSYYFDKGLSVRLFGGMFIDKSMDLPWEYGFQLSGDDGFHDYTYENTYLGRFEPPRYENAIRIFSQQFYPSEGGFALRSPLGITKDWLATVNVKTSIPLIEEIPLHAYANFGVFGGYKPISAEIKNDQWAFESGIKLSLLNFIDIYFPVTASKNLDRATETYSSEYGEKIRFHVRFDLFSKSKIYEASFID